MATTLNETNSEVAEETLIDRLFFPVKNGAPQAPWLMACVGSAGGALVFGVYRWYQQTYSFTVGLDYFEPEFHTYWMNLLYAQLALITLIGAVAVPWLWLTRPKEINITPMRELGVYNLMLTFMAVGSFMVVAVLGLFVEADAAWHQVTIRDTDFTPTHIGLFYFAIPLGAVGIIIGFVWLHTRMPDFNKRVSLPLCLMASAPILIMPNLGLNEWGHTFFYAEELFAAPIHWGFVTLGWGLFAMGGFLLQCFARIRVLTLTAAEASAREQVQDELSEAA
ncbi:MAG: methane monooxygenase/ammonia monooxygenase subunit C [Gammaproteobacteria bacterium]|nr:MAG: methane monooxygenase/ammonia monooxygenase subunit C [Gammaproteobacteria bacterium]